MDNNPVAEPSAQSSFFHCPECDMTVHENDRANHLAGSRHKYRMRKKRGKSDIPGTQYECSTCGTKFTDLQFFTIHQGSKTHKRNVRRLQKENVIERKKAEKAGTTSSPFVLASVDGDFKPTGRRIQMANIDKVLKLEDFRDTSDYKSVREKYRPKNAIIPEGNNRYYISSVTAWWALSLAFDSTVEDFKMSINDKEWGHFGDVVIGIDLKPTDDRPELSTTFAVQFKDTSNNVKAFDSLAEGRFALSKYMAQINTSRKELDNVKFVVFTTAVPTANVARRITLDTDLMHKMTKSCDCNGLETEGNVLAKPLSNRKKVFLNTSDDNENIYIFIITDHVHTLPKLYLYSQQKKQKHYALYIDDLISEAVDCDRKVQVSRDFTRFIDYWGEGFLGGNYKLKKEDVLVKLGHLLLYTFRIPPQVKTTEKRNYIIWTQAVNSVDVTILRKHPVVVWKICEPLNAKIESELKLSINTTNNLVEINQDVISHIENPVLKMYLFEETFGDVNDVVSLGVVYDFFWKAGLIPLLLEVADDKDQEYVLSVIHLLKYLGLTRRYLLVTSIDHNIKHSLRYFKNLSFFVTVDDIRTKLNPFLLDQVRIRASDQLSLSLRDIRESDPFFQKSIGAHEFYDMSLGRYSFKPFNYSLARRDGQDTQLVLDDDTMRKLREEIDSTDEMKMVMEESHVEEKKDWLRGIRPNLFN